MGVKLKVAGWLALGAVAGALTTLQLEATARGSMSQLPIEELQQLAAVFGMVKSDYVEPVDEKKLISDAIGGMVAGLDPHSQYFDKKTFKEFREATTGRFVGIGIEMGMEDGLVKVVSPIEGSPAFRAGLKSGKARRKRRLRDEAGDHVSRRGTARHLVGAVGHAARVALAGRDDAGSAAARLELLGKASQSAGARPGPGSRKVEPAQLAVDPVPGDRPDLDASAAVLAPPVRYRRRRTGPAHPGHPRLPPVPSRCDELEL